MKLQQKQLNKIHSNKTWTKIKSTDINITYLFKTFLEFSNVYLIQALHIFHIFFAHSPIVYKCMYTYVFNDIYIYIYTYTQDYFHKLSSMPSIVTPARSAVYCPQCSQFSTCTCLGASANLSGSKSGLPCHFSSLPFDCISCLRLWNAQPYTNVN